MCLFVDRNNTILMDGGTSVTIKKTRSVKRRHGDVVLVVQCHLHCCSWWMSTVLKKGGRHAARIGCGWGLYTWGLSEVGEWGAERKDKKTKQHLVPASKLKQELCTTANEEEMWGRDHIAHLCQCHGGNLVLEGHKCAELENCVVCCCWGNRKRKEGTEEGWSCLRVGIGCGGWWEWWRKKNKMEKQ